MPKSAPNPRPPTISVNDRSFAITPAEKFGSNPIGERNGDLRRRQH
jgi:hypothetical protein